MRVLHCIPTMEGGGAERQLTYLARELVKAGCDVHVALTRGGSNLPRLEESGAVIHDLGPAGNHSPRLLTRLLHTMRAIRPDVVQCWFLQMNLLGAVACAMTGTPWVLSERASAKHYPRTFKNLLNVRVASLATAIVSNSAPGNDYWRARANARVRRYVVANALPMAEITATRPATPKEAGLQTGETLVLHAGRLDAQKNVVTLVHALRRLPWTTSFNALLCGDGPLRPQIQQLIGEHGLQGRVRLAGYAPNLWSLMKRASVFVSPSWYEGSPNVVLEAMACGCPLVVSDIPAHRGLLDEQSAILFPGDDPDALARAISTVLDDPAGAAHRADAARRRAGQYGASLMAQRYLEVYRDVVGSRLPREASA
jgi:glycosyltransferase involved in cell wall biosynthesis